MRDVSDMELLRDYGGRSSEEAFAELVRRHINLVYSVAFRYVRVAAHAEEITQAVFVILAQKAAGLRPATVLESWLYETTRLTSLSFLRGERRRRLREQEAYMQSTTHATTDDSVWQQLAPVLDEAMARLGQKDREAVILRFFKEKNLGEVAAALEMTEAAAQSRVHRAVNKLRKFFIQRGLVLTTGAIGDAISANSVQAAPVALAKSVTAVALAKGATASSSTLILSKGALKLMAWSKMSTAVAVITVAVLATGISVVVVKNNHLIQGQTENEWIKSIVYRGDSAETERWRALGPKGIQMLAHALQSPASDRPTRMGVANMLVRLGAAGADAKEALPALLYSLQSESNNRDQSVRECVLSVFEVLLPSMDEKEKAQLLPEFLGAMSSTSPTVRNNALVALRSYTNQAKSVDPALVAALRAPEVRVRLRAAEALIRVDLPTAAASGVIPILVEILKDPDDQIACQAPSVLGEMGPEAASAVPSLLASARGPDRLVAYAAGRAVKQIDPTAAAQAGVK